MDTTTSVPCGIGSGPYSSSSARTYMNTSGFPTVEKSNLPLVHGRFVAIAEFQASAVDPLATLRSRSGIKVNLLFVHVRPDM